MAKKRAKTAICNFCGMITNTNEAFVRDQKMCICKDCLDIANTVFQNRTNNKLNNDVENFNFTPTELKEKLDEYIVGQEEAKKIISVAVYNHYKRVVKLKDEDIDKTNICLVGASGSGKTLMAKTIAKILHVPIVIADSTSFTASGYVGRNVEDMLKDLIRKADNNIKKAEHGIIFLDEVDKIATRETNGKDIGGESVQQGLLKIIEGSPIYLNIKEEENFFNDEEETPSTCIDTSNILFIVSGAFSGIEKIVGKSDKSSIGFNSEQTKITDENCYEQITQDDLIAYGMLPEFVGRLQTIASLHKLDEDSMIKILTEPKNSLIKQYQKLLNVDGITLQFDDKALKKIAQLAIKHKTGARYLKSILENTMMDIMFEAPGKRNKQTIVIKEKDIKTLEKDIKTLEIEK